jgi:hypothetical protein
MNRRLPNSQVYTPLLVAPDGTRHMLPGKEHAAYCGATEGTRHAPQWIGRRYVCQRCLQKYVKAIEQ